jgi:methyl-accepting chemotaxis protein
MKILFRKLTISQTIIFLSAFLFSLQVLYGLIINSNLNSIGHHITEIETQYIPLTKKITLLSEHQLKQEIEFERIYRLSLVLNKEVNDLERFTHATHAFSQLSNKIDEDISFILSELSRDISIARTEHIKKDLTLLSQHVEAFKNNHERWVNEITAFLDLLKNQNSNSVSAELDVIENHAVDLEHDVIDILHEIEKFTEKSIHALNEEDQSALLAGIILVSFSLLMSIKLNWLLLTLTLI